MKRHNRGFRGTIRIDDPKINRLLAWDINIPLWANPCYTGKEEIVTTQEELEYLMGMKNREEEDDTIQQ